MWIPVVSDSLCAGLTGSEESRLEAMLEVVPEAVLATIGFVWVRDEPTDDCSGLVYATFRPGASESDCLAALVHDNHERMVLELYARRINSGLSDSWLAENWGILPCGLPLTIVDKAEVVVFGALLTLAVRKGMIEEAQTLVRLVGRVVFRAAVRCALAKLVIKSESVSPPLTPPEQAGRRETRRISQEEIDRIDWDALLRQLLGLATDTSSCDD
jgi:hypothetical protein